MSKRYLFIPSLLTISAVLVSCTERTAPTDTAPTTPPVVDDFINGPASPGNSGIFRFQDVVVEATFDFNAGLVSVHGLLNTVADLCADLGEFDLMDLQLKPHSADEVNSLIVDRESPVQILAIPPEGLGESFCADFSGAPVLYSGTAAFRETDNNETETGTEGGRANSFGWTSQGVLDDLVNGGQVRYSEEVRILINPQTEEFTVPVSNISVH
jgi:hypothetical protein